MDINLIQQRLVELRENAAQGEAQLRALDARTIELKTTLLRIAGAIQVLEELESEAKLKQDGS